MDTIERIPELAEQARASLAAAGYDRRRGRRVGDGTLGLPERAPFDAIAVAAAAPELPETLYEQLRARADGSWCPSGGRRDAAARGDRPQPGRPGRGALVPCRFVPLLGRRGSAVRRASASGCAGGVQGVFFRAGT